MIPYFNIDLKVTIGDKIDFNVANSIHIENSVEKLTDIAKIELPREFKQAVQNGKSFSIAGKNLLEYIKIGDSIKIEIGYDGNLETEFEGYISNIGAEIPMELECEDEMYLLKRAKPINKTFSKVSLKELLQFIAPAYKVDCFDLSVGKYMIENATPYKVLEDLKERYGVRCFIRNKVLYAGLQVNFNPIARHEFNMNRNVRKGSDLKYETKEVKKLKIKAISKQKGTSKNVTYEFGDDGESEITLHAPIGLNKEELKKWAESHYKNKKYDGYTGSFDSWGLPRTKAGDSANLTDPNYPDGHRDGNFFISEVVIDLNESDGFKRKNSITYKL